MTSINNWLLNEPEWNAIPFLIIKAIFIIYFIGVCGVGFAALIGIDVPRNPAVDFVTGYSNTKLFLTLLVAGFIEELLFRFIPITIGTNGFKSIKLTYFLCIISSIIFGYLHGSMANFFAQGLMGLGFCIFYLKFGASNKKIIKPLLATSLTHCLFNFILFISFQSSV